MPRIFIARADSARDRKDLERSVEGPVERHTIISHFSDATYPELIDIERRGRGFYAWGLPAGEPQVHTWFGMGVGDFALIISKGVYRHYAKVLGRYDNASAAQAIWANDGEDPPRELLFFLSEPIELQLPCDELSDYFAAPTEAFEPVDKATIERIEADFGTIERFFRRRLLNTGVGGPVLDMSGIIKISERDHATLQNFNAASSKDARTRVVENIIQRRGEPGFRRMLLAAYDYQCAITSCNAVDALEAACIIPYRGRYTHEASNGLLLRADLHTLFDLGKIAVDTQTMTLVMADDLLDSSYRILVGRPLRYPREESDRPNVESLDLHRRLAGL